MHLELPEKPLKGFKDFLKHYLMIVLSILTALGLEAWIEHAHHARAASAASAQLKEELRANLDSVLSTIKKNEATMQHLDRMDHLVTGALSDKTASDAINQQIHLHRDDYQIAMYFPDIRTNAWNVAIANQSVTWMPSDQLRVYSTAYTDLREMTDWEQHGMYAIVDLPKAYDVKTDLAVGRNLDPIAFMHTVRQMRDALRQTNANLASMVTDLSKAIATNQ